MPRKSAASAVTTRQLAPPPPEVSEEELQNLLYRPVPQLEGPVPFKVKYEWIGPERAQALLQKADSDPEFRQRPTRTADIRRWRNLQTTKRFVNFLPMPICIDPAGIMLNGKHRMTATAGQDDDHGFVVFYDVPRWMFAFFDTNRVRTLKDVFHIGARATGPQTGSAMKLGMRYEEFLMGLRSPFGWRHWALGTRDEHEDVDEFLSRRSELQDWYGVGEKTYRFVKLIAPSVMVFRFYQGLAWPDGDAKLTQFCESLVTGEMLAPSSPVTALREWSREVYYNQERLFAKRELHLMLLFRSFEQFVQGSRIPKVQWAYGMPMTMPYHPGGHELGIKNVKEALAELDQEA